MIKIYGKNCVYEAVASKAPVKTYFISDVVAKKDNKIIDMLNKIKAKYQVVSKDKLDKEFPNGNQGYGAYRENYTLLENDYLSVLPKNQGRVLLLDGIEDPHNLGAILRSVDAFGFDLVILPKNRSCGINETVAHVSTGAIEHVNIALVNSLLNAVNTLKKENYWICGTDAKGNIETKNISEDLNLAVIIGSEGFGMSKTLVNASDYLISIPMIGHVNSLNASVSTGIVLHELMTRK